MLIAILGVIILVVGIVLKRSPEPGSRFGGIVNIVGIVVIALGLISSMFKQIEPGRVIIRCNDERSKRTGTKTKTGQ